MEETAPKNTDCAENDVPEDPQNKAILKAMKDMDAGNGKNILSASIETFSMADGKNKRGDSLVEVLDDALMLIKGMVVKSSELEIAKAEKKKKKKKKRTRRSPLRTNGTSIPVPARSSERLWTMFSSRF